ncbi:hypothetical protein CKAH01_03766 [Colletotrichum kahawae]|uniref:Uncharacterized protein n=1 Tax=Colletotrichum kahawae TaxID=34407 RepID=A0AAD9YR43_COLKA|nr:hypothetical protein CKAH01_03766 [Colletotrichum kahawae]
MNGNDVISDRSSLSGLSLRRLWLSCGFRLSKRPNALSFEGVSIQVISTPTSNFQLQSARKLLNFIIASSSQRLNTKLRQFDALSALQSPNLG